MPARADKKKNLGKVAKVIANNPLATEKEIADKAGVSSGTAHNMLKELEKNGVKDFRIIAITDKDINILSLAQQEIERRLSDEVELERMGISDLERVATGSQKRYSLFRGTATDENGGMKELGIGDILKAIQQK